MLNTDFYFYYQTVHTSLWTEKLKITSEVTIRKTDIWVFSISANLTLEWLMLINIPRLLPGRPVDSTGGRNFYQGDPRLLLEKPAASIRDPGSRDRWLVPGGAAASTGGTGSFYQEWAAATSNFLRGDGRLLPGRPVAATSTGETGGLYWGNWWLLPGTLAAVTRNLYQGDWRPWLATSSGETGGFFHGDWRPSHATS